ncbi:protein translocase subunit SecD [Dictyobacter arantiisoli]|uniref:Protein translocase subunit SecD n=1 Tax=Dictyobacter arantiisoli TaxID=2014874 RepID=A0A5A5TI08_9CHLR|nr:protein translocase subunit SecD [Dictyobacter arantiisoli]GCF10693.1 protein translocase subunit SecD [Dictyobacter arantiisoli]
MRRGTIALLIFIILLAAGASFVVFWPNRDVSLHGVKVNNPFTVTLGLDLQGGYRVQLEPKPNQNVTSDNMETTRQLIEQRVNSGLGVKEANVVLQQGYGSNSTSIVVELPNFSGDQNAALQTLLKSGKLEFWNTGSSGLQDGTTFVPSQYTSTNPGGKPIFTGGDLDPNGLSVGQDPQTNKYLINFQMKTNTGAAARFGQFTANNVGKYMTVTLDDTVVTSAVIQGAITGQGQINGNFTQQSASQVVQLLKYGSLPVALDQTSEQIIGGTLGAQAIAHAILAGIIGLAVVALFMLLYYRLPGFLADIALVIYAVVTFAIFKMIGVTMSLAGIAGFILSIGMAVDANVLIFERVKEELRAGRLLASAIDIGWKRAWPSIRDSNTSTMLTCAVLYAFGNNFGATIIVGFATTLFLGVVISMFTAIVVTRTLLNLLVPTGVINHPALFGISADAIPTAKVARRNSAV